MSVSPDPSDYSGLDGYRFMAVIILEGGSKEQAGAKTFFALALGNADRRPQ